MTDFFRLLALVTLVAASSGIQAQEGSRERDQRAMDVLAKMSAYKDSVGDYRITGESSSDARMSAGLMVANTQEVTVTVSGSGSMHFKGFNGSTTRELFIHEGKLSVIDSAAGTFAQAGVPENLDEALEMALEDYDVDLPLMDLVHTNVIEHIVEPKASVHYLGDKRRVNGRDCHQLAIRLEEVDVQLWIAEGDKPLPARIAISAKWEGGAPRFIGNMEWDTSPQIRRGEFEFEPPEGAARIEFEAAASE
jgi:hypothetical protein